MKVELFQLESSGDYLNACILFLKEYQKKPLLTFYLDGFFRNYKKLVTNDEIKINQSTKNMIFDIFGFIPDISKKKEKLVFIGHSFHSKTLSAMFFLEILFDLFNVHILWSLDWMGIKDRYYDSLEKYDVVIFWQILPDTKHYIPIKNKRYIIPMLDGVTGITDSLWKKYSDYRFISFSNILHRKFIDLNFNSLNVQAAPAPKISRSRLFESSECNRSGLTLFFWQRTDSINWNDVKQKIKNNIFSKIFLMLEVDPGCRPCLPSKNDIETYNIEIIEWFADKKNLKDILGQCDIYVAPRVLEGIGFSFLDAMAMGCVIMANNAATMNEYINNEIGYLVNFKDNSVVNFDDIHIKRKKSFIAAYRNERHWLLDRKKIVNYLK